MCFASVSSLIITLVKTFEHIWQLFIVCHLQKSLSLSWTFVDWLTYAIRLVLNTLLISDSLLILALLESNIIVSNILSQPCLHIVVSELFSWTSFSWTFVSAFLVSDIIVSDICLNSVGMLTFQHFSLATLLKAQSFSYSTLLF